MRVVCAVEGEAHVHHCAAMLHSLLGEHPPATIRIEYLHGGDTSARGRKRLAAMVARLGGEIAFHDVPERWLSGLPVKGFTGKATWYRLFLDRLLPDADRVLYLDLDLVVLQSLEQLWRTPLHDHVLAAVTNVPTFYDRAYTERAELGGDRYFNAGVLLLDLACVRREGIGEQLRALALQHAARMSWRDQDALNELLHARRLPLHPRWNCMNSIMNFGWAADYFDAAELAEARRDPAIRHFEGPAENKPWHLLGDREGLALYRKHRSHTPWPRMVRSGVTPANVARYSRRSHIVRRTVAARIGAERYERARRAVVGLMFQAWARTGRRPAARLFLNDLIAKTGNFSSTSWLGVPIWQNVLDLWTIQETIAEIKPALLIETGTNRGGSALFYASLMDLIGQGKVLTIDIERLHQLDHPRIDFLHGSSTDPQIVEQVRSAARAADGPVMVILDGDHSQQHVAHELELYAEFVTPGSVILSQDGVIDQLWLFSDSRPGPLGANQDFLARHPEFEHDRERNERFLVSHHPVGWLRRRQ